MSAIPRPNHCSCRKAPGLYGEAGFHWRPDSEWPNHRQADVAVEQCPQYRAAMARRVEAVKADPDPFKNRRRPA